MNAASRIWTPIDYDVEGKQCDCLRLPFSSDLSAYGFLPIPISCIKSGPGPTALLVAGSHGDEYEGQVALNNLIRELDPGDVNGRIIILPALNFPAVEAGRRVSPLDDGNLNRLFPGDPLGSPTQMIAHYVSEILIPLADVVVDLHAGGRSLDYLPSALIRAGRTPEETRSLLELAKVFGAPVSSISDGSGGGGATTLAATAQQLNVPAITAELGGGAALSDKGKDLAEQGVRRVLKRFGIVKDAATQRMSAVTRLMKVQGRDAFTYAQTNGIFEPAAGVGETVIEGQLAGKIHPIGWPMRDVEMIRFKQSGLVACRRVPSLAKPGDCLFKVMADLNADAGVVV
ncbi:succinylglutamate desuccinylase/aspartoacylase family protein [Mesorhizobium sp. SB112]|uniref:succinylglutamate desuccinylase/aspartoacylase family protein n=1 Tax=Mesorhizobium sp. SB112 TaxID=3151853 RepID=UPI00326574E8